MLDDLRRLEDGAELDADVCIIGAGAAGIALATEFLDTRARVILVESGGLRRSAATERLNDGEASGLEPTSLTAGRARALGGTTVLWAGQCLRADPATFEERPWVPYSGWPLEYRELEPFYRRAETLLRIRGKTYDERVWDDFRVERPSFDRHRLMHRFTVWCPHPDLGRLCRRALAASRNVTVLLHTTATEIRVTPAGDRFDHLRVATLDGQAGRVRARACVVAAGGVENARLLLASNGVHAAGLGNRHDVVGRFFQDHPNGHCATIVSEDAARLQDLYGLFYRRRVRYLPRLVLSAELQRSREVLACAAHPVFHFGEESGIEAARRIVRPLRRRQRPTNVGRDLGRIARDAPRLGSVALRRFAHGRSAREQPVLVTLQTHAEQAPNPDSRVVLSRRRDDLGLPLPTVEWRLTDLDRRTAETMVRGVAEEFGRLGLGAVRPEPWLADSRWTRHVVDSYHHMGTTRMGADRKTSVVNRDGQVHGVTGLFVAGSSVFPAAGHASPTLTIVALAIRLGDHLKDTLDRLPAREP
jgi:choline dehydrogenase-like flavoprotein